MIITYWSDYACPFCFIGEAKLKKAMANLNIDPNTVKWEMKAYQLDPTAPLKAEKPNLQKSMERYKMSEEEALERMKPMLMMAEEEGLKFNYATALNTNTMDAHRLTKYAQQEEPRKKAEALIEQLYEDYFTNNLELADHEVLKQAAQKAGLNMERVEQVLSSEEYKDLVLQEENEAAVSGIHGVPFFVIGRYGISGAQPVELFQEVLETVQKEESQKTFVAGQTCGPDGCD